MKFLYIIILCLLGCKTVPQSESTYSETEAFIFTLGKDYIYLIPVENYNQKITIEENLKSVIYKDGHQLNSLTQVDYENIIKESSSFKRADITNDYADNYKNIKILPVKIKYKKVPEENQSLYKESKKLKRHEILLENKVKLNLKYDCLNITVIDIDLL